MVRINIHVSDFKHIPAIGLYVSPSLIIGITIESELSIKHESHGIDRDKQSPGINK